MRRRLASINDAPIAERRIASRGIADQPRLLNHPQRTDPPTAPSDRRDQNDAAAKGTDPAPVSRGAVRARWAPIPLRLIVGLGFMAHGVAKLSRGADVFAATLQGLGVPSPDLAAWSTIVVELLWRPRGDSGGVRAARQHPDGGRPPGGDRHRPSALRLQLHQAHRGHGSGPQFGKPGYETALLYLACLATLLLGGPGGFAWTTGTANAKRTLNNEQ